MSREQDGAVLTQVVDQAPDFHPLIGIEPFGELVKTKIGLRQDRGGETYRCYPSTTPIGR